MEFYIFFIVDVFSKLELEASSSQSFWIQHHSTTDVFLYSDVNVSCEGTFQGCFLGCPCQNDPFARSTTKPCAMSA